MNANDYSTMQKEGQTMGLSRRDVDGVAAAREILQMVQEIRAMYNEREAWCCMVMGVTHAEAEKLNLCLEDVRQTSLKSGTPMPDWLRDMPA